jgi:hypothetical protein
MDSDRDTRRTSPRVGCPIRRSRDHRSLASPPGFSQRATSFLASQCQGIHQMPFVALDPSQRRRRAQEQNPRTTALSRKDTSSDGKPPRDIPQGNPSGPPSAVTPQLSLHPSINTEFSYQNSAIGRSPISDFRSLDLREPSPAAARRRRQWRCPVDAQWR